MDNLYQWREDEKKRKVVRFGNRYVIFLGLPYLPNYVLFGLILNLIDVS